MNASALHKQAIVIDGHSDILIPMAEGKMRLRPLVTHHVPFDRGDEMYRMILAKSEPFLGITLDWTGAS